MPQSIEEYVSKDNPVRAYDFFVEALDFRQLGIDSNPNKVGNAEYDPLSIFKLLVYGYSYEPCCPKPRSNSVIGSGTKVNMLWF